MASSAGKATRGGLFRTKSEIPKDQRHKEGRLGHRKFYTLTPEESRALTAAMRSGEFDKAFGAAGADDAEDDAAALRLLEKASNAKEEDSAKAKVGEAAGKVLGVEKKDE